MPIARSLKHTILFFSHVWSQPLVGPAHVGLPRSVESSPISFFLENLLLFEFKSESCKMRIKINIRLNDLIQISLKTLLQYLFNGTGPTPFRSFSNY
jgi:hypothetical protein